MGNNKLALGLRTAFGDVSNTANSNRFAQVKDDLAYPTKQKAHVPEKTTNIPAPQEKRVAALSRPAQRPISVSGLKGLLTGSSTAKEVEPSSKAAPALDQQNAVPLAANSRKLLSKRSTTIFKDAPLPAVTEIPSLQNENPSSDTALSSTLAPVHQTLHAPQKVFKDTSKQTTRATLKPTQTVPEDSLPSTDHLPKTENAKDSERSSSETIESDEAQTFHDSLPVQVVDEVKSDPNLAVEVNHLLHSVPSLPAMPGPLVDPVNTRYSHPSIPEAEEYWDDEENVEDDGYVTAHSYRSKGDNTTGGATISLFPQVTRQVKKELDAAKELVEASRTAEEIEDECYDTSMVAEYGDEIFDYMRELEVSYMKSQDLVLQN